MVRALGVPRSVQKYICILIVILQKLSNDGPDVRLKRKTCLRGTLVRDGPASALLRHLDLCFCILILILRSYAMRLRLKGKFYPRSP
jgi:hypothetical protein